MNDLFWISPALIAGLAASRLGLPPMVGYLLCGFALNLTGIYDHDRLTMIGNLGVTLLLFTVGLKLEPRYLLRPTVWAVTTMHSALVVTVLGLLLYLLSFAGLQAFMGLTLQKSALVAFALSFSSTVFAVKTLEDKGDYLSSYGQTAIGVLIMQDIFAVGFLAASTGMLPSVWALTLLILIPGRYLLKRLLDQAGHSGELQILYGLAMAYGSYALFSAVDVKGDLGALIAGILVASHPLAPQVSERLLGFKDLLLVGFFLSIGMSGEVTLTSALLSLFLALLVVCKTALFFILFTKFRMRARTAVLSSLTLANYSEFGLIVGAVSVSNGWLSEQWLVIIALALTLTVVLTAPLNARGNRFYERGRSLFEKYESKSPLSEDRPPDFAAAEIVVIGMGRLGTAVYDQLRALGHQAIGLESDPEVVLRHQSEGRNVVRGDANDKELWESTTNSKLKTGIVAFPRQQRNLCVVSRVRECNPNIDLFAVAVHQEEVSDLKRAGAKGAWNLYSEAGRNLARGVVSRRSLTPSVTQMENPPRPSP